MGYFHRQLVMDNAASGSRSTQDASLLTQEDTVSLYSEEHYEDDSDDDKKIRQANARALQKKRWLQPRRPAMVLPKLSTIFIHIVRHVTKIQLKNWVVMIVLGQSEMYKAVYVEILISQGQDKRL